MNGRSHRPSRVEVDAGAIGRNVAELVELARPAVVCAVVKADGYGHGAVTAATAALAAGASSVAVATVDEALELREAGVGSPILVLSEPSPGAWPIVAGSALDVMVYTAEGIAAAGAAGAATGSEVRAHLKVDTGMHRVGCDPSDALDLARRIVHTPGVSLAALATHLASADDHDSLFPAVQLERFGEVDRRLRDHGVEGYVRHAANSAATLGVPASRFEMVRCGIACYGIAPAEWLTDRMTFHPAARVVSAVSLVRRLDAGEPVSYACRYVTPTETTIATVPVGYADGVPRSLGLRGGFVLIGGIRHPVVGVVTMDQLMVDVGDAPVAIGDEVVLVGPQGEDELAANEVATRQGTIGYEIVARLGPRLPRVPVT